jgi:hypothetical protein
LWNSVKVQLQIKSTRRATANQLQGCFDDLPDDDGPPDTEVSSKSKQLGKIN